MDEKGYMYSINWTQVLTDWHTAQEYFTELLVESSEDMPEAKAALARIMAM